MRRLLLPHKRGRLIRLLAVRPDLAISSTRSPLAWKIQDDVPVLSTLYSTVLSPNESSHCSRLIPRPLTTGDAPHIISQATHLVTPESIFLCRRRISVSSKSSTIIPIEYGDNHCSHSAIPRPTFDYTINGRLLNTACSWCIECSYYGTVPTFRPEVLEVKRRMFRCSNDALSAQVGCLSIAYKECSIERIPTHAFSIEKLLIQNVATKTFKKVHTTICLGESQVNLTFREVYGD